MPTPPRGPRLGAGPAHERAILRGLSRDLIRHGQIVTTETKAKRVRPFVEKIITKARKGGLHNRRMVLAELNDRTLVYRLFTEIAPRIGDRPGGYTRILKLGQRRGDATSMAIIELVDEPLEVRTPEPEEPRRGRRRRRRAVAEAETEATDLPDQAPEPAEPAEEEPAEPVAEPAEPDAEAEEER